jgi:Family of unknown function (DUF5678)
MLGEKGTDLFFAASASCRPALSFLPREERKTMLDITVEDILAQIAKLPPTEQLRLRYLLEQQQQESQQPTKPPQGRRVPPIPVPDSRSEMQWLAAHGREYAGQWVALDGDRLLAHGPQHQEVWAAAEASGVYLPLVTFVENPDRVYAGF